jgi:AraC-like DNA-binding protein
MILVNDCLILHVFRMSIEETGEEVPMTIMITQQAEREVKRLASNREELIERIARIMREDGTAQPLQGLYLARASFPLTPSYGVIEPSVCVIAQGSKEVLLGDSRYHYDPFHYLLATVDLPCASRVMEASKERPYLSLRLELTPILVSSVMVEADMVETDHASPRNQTEVRAMDVSLLEGNLLDAFVRLVRLLDSPVEAPVLLPLITREIIYRLLMGKQGAQLRHRAIPSGYTPHIARAVEWLRHNFDQPLRIEHLAHELGMSASALHHHFKAVTALSPLQFQKQLRLQEARRLMLGEGLDAKVAAYRVGYQDASHFNREYRSLFGVPPMRDVQQLRGETPALSGQ